MNDIFEEEENKTEREDGRLQAKEREQILPSRPSEETNPVGTLILDFQLPDRGTINCCCLNHPGCGTLLRQP